MHFKSSRKDLTAMNTSYADILINRSLHLDDKVRNDRELREDEFRWCLLHNFPYFKAEAIKTPPLGNQTAEVR
jgi:hypothetical protein